VGGFPRVRTPKKCHVRDGDIAADLAIVSARWASPSRSSTRRQHSRSLSSSTRTNCYVVARQDPLAPFDTTSRRGCLVMLEIDVLYKRVECAADLRKLRPFP